MEQRKELPEDAWNNVKRVSMKFEKMEGKFPVFEPSTGLLVGMMLTYVFRTL